MKGARATLDDHSRQDWRKEMRQPSLILVVLLTLITGCTSNVTGDDDDGAPDATLCVDCDASIIGDASTLDALALDASPPDAVPIDADLTPDARAAAWGVPPTNFTVVWEYTGTCAGEPIGANGCVDLRSYTAMTVSAVASKWRMRFTDGTAYYHDFSATIGTFGDAMYFWAVDQAVLSPFNNVACPWQSSMIYFAAHTAEQVSATQLVGESRQTGWTRCYAVGSSPNCQHRWRYTATVQ